MSDSTANYELSVHLLENCVSVNSVSSCEQLIAKTQELKAAGVDYMALKQLKVVVDLVTTRHFAHPDSLIAETMRDVLSFNALPLNFQINIMLSCVYTGHPFNMEYYKSLSFLAENHNRNKTLTADQRKSLSLDADKDAVNRYVECLKNYTQGVNSDTELERSEKDRRRKRDLRVKEMCRLQIPGEDDV